MNIAQDIANVLDKHGKAFLSIRQVTAGIPRSAWKHLGLTKQTSVGETLTKLTPHLGEQLQVYRGARTIYIGYPHPPEDLIVQTLQHKTALSPKRLGTTLPLQKKIYMQALNGLLECGTVVCTFTDNDTPRLTLAPATHPNATPQTLEADDRQTFYQGYLTIGQGRSFVRIHRLREALPWSQAHFDQVLTALAADYTIELHGGDPSHMTAVERQESFTDAHGLTSIALSWRGDIS